MKLLISIIILLTCNCAFALEKADVVLVSKTNKTLYLFKNAKLLASYPVVFGSNPKGHKEREGDGRTPEGRYLLDFKKANSSFHKAVHVSYPNQKDKKMQNSLV